MMAVVPCLICGGRAWTSRAAALPDATEQR